MALTLADFKTDRHGAPFHALLTAHPVVTNRLLEILNAPANEAILVHAEEQDRAPLAGIARVIEADAVMTGALKSRTDGKRFRQAVAVAVKLKMLSLGWSTTGRKGQVTQSRYFEFGERFKP